jgi:hypothetical protein
MIYGFDATANNGSFLLTVWKTPGKTELSIVQSGITTRYTNCSNVVLRNGEPGEWFVTVPLSCFRFPSSTHLSISMVEAARALTVNDDVTFMDADREIIRTYP